MEQICGAPVQRGGSRLELVSDSRNRDVAVDGDSGAVGEWLSGVGSVLIAVYIILAIAATARSVFQILTRFDEAPLAYTLSAVAGAVYILATVALIMGRRRERRVWRALAWAALSFELAGVLTVGTLSLTHPEIFGHETVWSLYGAGYIWVPLVLPVLGMLWLRREGTTEDPEPTPDPNESLY